MFSPTTSWSKKDFSAEANATVWWGGSHSQPVYIPDSCHQLFAKLSIHLLSSTIFPCSVVRPSRIGNNSTYLHYMMFKTIQTIYSMLGNDPGNVSATSKTNTKTKTHTKTKTKTKTGKNFWEKVFMYMHCLQATYYTSPESWGHCLSFCDDNENDKDTHKDKYKDKDKDNDKDKVLKRPITCYVFEKQGVQGYQIRRLQ